MASPASIPVKGPKPLPHLPFEILKQIGDQLDRHTAVQLSLTCKALRNAGESRIWSSIEVCTDWRPFFITYSTRTPPPLVTPESQLATIKPKLELILQALKSYPARIECINALYIEPLVDLQVPMFQLLKLVHSRIHTLVVLTPHASYGDLDLFTSKETEITGWPMMRNLRWTVQKHSTPLTAQKLLSKMPNVSHLELYSRDFYGTVPTPWPNLDKVTHLSLAEFDGDFEYLVPALIKATPNLTELYITGASEYGAREDEICEAVRKSANLRTIHWLVDQDPEYGRNRILDKGPEKLERYTDNTIEMDNEAYELEVANMEQIPRNTTVKHYTTILGPRISPSEYAELGTEITPLADRRTQHLGSRIARRLNLAPCLLDIQFGAEKYDRLQPDFFRRPTSLNTENGSRELDWPVQKEMPSDLWEVKGLRGLIVRTYTNHVNGETFYHCRMITRAREDADAFYVGARRLWHDFTRYRGRVVPYSTLREVYAAVQQDAEWKTGGRDLSLNRAAWTVLDNWFEETPPAPFDDMDGAFGDTDSDDDDDDDDDDDGAYGNMDQDDEWEDYDDGMDDGNEEDFDEDEIVDI